MVSRGARHLIFLSRSGAASQAAQELLSQLDRASCQFKVCQCDVANREQLSDVLRECGHPMPPIRGCIQAAMVLDVSIESDHPGGEELLICSGLDVCEHVS